MSSRPLKVFLCHAHADRDPVRALYSRLTKDGVDAWLDKEKLLPGQDWELEIRKAVREADVVVVCLSTQFNQAGFRQKEVRLALDTAMEQPEGEIFIIPARLEECDNLESLRKWHWVDLFDNDGYEMLMRALMVRADNIGVALKSEKELRPGPDVVEIVDKEPLTNFRIAYKKTMDMLFSRSVLICGFFGVFVAGFFWTILNNLLLWTYYLGGSGNEPHGFSAFAWGAIAIFPVIFFAYIAFYKDILTTSRLLGKASMVIMLYTIFGGVGALLFYDLGFRNYIEIQKLGYGAQELIIVIIWASVISLLASLPALLLNRVLKEVQNSQFIYIQILLAVVFSFLAVVVSLFFHMPETNVAQLRGFLAGLGLKFGLYIGMALSIFFNPDKR